MITNLTKEQKSRFSEFVEKWTKIGLCTEPANRPLAEEGINKAYQIAGLEPPEKIIWCGSPISQALTKIILKNLTSRETNNTVENSVRNSVRNSVWNSVENSVWDSVRNSVGNSVRDIVGNSFWNSIRDTFWNSISDSVMDIVRDIVGNSISDSVSDNVRDSVWNSDNVRDSVRNSVSDTVWNSVSDTVYRSVSDTVWHNVSDTVWHSRSVVWESIYGQHDAAWLGFYDYFKTVCNLTQETQLLEGLWQVAQNCGWWLPCQNICFASERHNLLKFNEQKQVHCDGGPAIQYPDGWSIWVLNGVEVPQWLSETPVNQLNPKDILKLENAQQRAEGVRKVGIERLLYSISPGPIDQKGNYELHVIDIGENNKGHYLKMQNPSVPELWHVEGVPSECNTVEKALNWRNQLSEDQIDDVNGADWYQQGDVIIRPKGVKKFKRNPIVLT